MLRRLLIFVGVIGIIGLTSQLVAQNIIPTCEAKTATVYVDASNIVHGGPDEGHIYNGILRGTSGKDVMVGTRGNDTINGYDSDDIICGGDGDDDIYGGRGSEDIYGGRGADYVYGERGSDNIYGERGDDILCGGRDEDDLVGGRENDLIQFDGTDTVDTSEGDDQTTRDCGTLTPTPTPIPTSTPTPTPTPTSTTISNINLVVGGFRLDPPSPNCGQPFNIYLDVANLGSDISPSGLITFNDYRASDGMFQSGEIGAFPSIAPGQTINLGPILLMVNTFYNENHRLDMTIDSNNAISETNEADNTKIVIYLLNQATCP